MLSCASEMPTARVLDCDLADHPLTLTWVRIRGSRLGVDGLRFRVQGLPLRCRPIDYHKTLETQCLPRCRHCLDPSLELAPLVGLLPRGRHCFGDHPAQLVLHELVLSQATDGLLLPATVDSRLTALASCNFAHLHGFLHAPFHGHLHRPLRRSLHDGRNTAPAINCAFEAMTL